jgi:hypothetical protein
VTRRARRALVGVILGLTALAGCSDDGEATSSTTTTEERATVAPQDPELVDLLITADDLPAGFSPSGEIDDTITTFCAGQDAAAGLSASGRALAGFTRDPAGASVIELVFRFEDDGAARFVEQAEELLTTCSEVPDASGLAFSYEPLSDAVAATLDSAQASAGGFGTSVGSADITVQVAVVQSGDLGALVAVLGVEQPRVDSDALAARAFTAALERLAG